MSCFGMETGLDWLAWSMDQQKQLFDTTARNLCIDQSPGNGEWLILASPVLELGLSGSKQPLLGLLIGSSQLGHGSDGTRAGHFW